MDREELRLQFEKNIEYLRRIVPPDDIYAYAEQTFMATLFFLHKWRNVVDLEDECERDEIAKKWVMNIAGFLACRDMNMDIQIDLKLEQLMDDDEDNS